MSSMYGSSLSTQLMSGIMIRRPMTFLICNIPFKIPSISGVPEYNRTEIPVISIKSGNLYVEIERDKLVKTIIAIPANDKRKTNRSNGKKLVVKCKSAYVKVEILNPHTMILFIINYK